MARSSKPVQSGSTSNNRILVPAPEPNASLKITSIPSGTLVYGFDTDEATFGRAGASLEIRLDNGGAVTIVDYFAVGNKALPNFELPDGSVVTAQDFLSASAPGMDLSTASGPTASQQTPGSGSGEYREGAGDLVGSVDRLGKLGTSYNQWDNGTLGVQDLGSSGDVSYGGGDISISDPFGAGPGGPTVHEAGLENGTNPGEGVDSGWHQMNLPDGIRVVGVPDGGSATFPGEFGILTVRHLGGSSYEYSYTLTRPHTGDGANDGRNTVTDADLITIQITDGRTIGSAQVAIDIVDDAPEVRVGQGSGPEGDDSPAYSGFDVTGEWEVNFGADGEKSGGGLQMKIIVNGKERVVDVTPDTEIAVEVNGVRYGTIEFKSDGTYVFKPVSNLEQKITIILGATDADGDFVEANDGKGIVLDVKKPSIDGFGSLGDKPDEWFSETNIKGGTTPNLSQTTKDIALPDGMEVDVSKDWEAHKDADGNTYYTRDTDYGHLTYYPPVEGGNGALRQPPRLTYTLDKAAMHDGEEVFYDKSAGKVTLVDAGGNTYEVDTNFRIYDDEPVVTFDGTGGESVESGHDFKGTWSTVFGADGAAEEDSIFVTITVDGKSKDFPVTPDQKITLEIDGKVYGEIEFKTGGDFVFTPAPNLEAEIELSLSAKDAEGDVVTSKGGGITINVTHPEGPGDVSLRPKDDDPVRESALPEGTNPNPDDLVKEIEIPPGFEIDTDGPGWVKQPDGTYVKENEDGSSKLVYNPDDNTLIYELEKPQDHDDQGRDKKDDIFDDLVLKDDKGNTYEDIKVIVELEDDIPEVSVTIDSNTVDEDGSVSGSIDYDFGSDGPHEDEPLQVTVTGPDGEQVTFPIKNEKGEQVIDVVIDGKDYGDLVVNLDPDKGTGQFEFRPEPDKGGTDLEFEFSAKDKDGDIVTAPGDTISIIDKDGPGINFIGGGKDEWFSESNLPEGTDPGNGAALTKPIGLPDDCSIDVSKGGWKLDPATGNYVLEGQYGYLSCDADGNNLTYTLTDRADHSASGNDKVLDHIPGITIRDGDGKEHELPAKITVYDDEPEVFFSGGQSGNTIGSGQSFEGSWDVNFGADGEKAGGGLQLEVTVGGNKALIDIDPDKPTAIIVDGKNYGTITLNSSTGKYEFTAAPNTGGSLKFVLVATDSEGDVVRSGDGFTIKVTGPEGPGSGQLTGKGDTVSESALPDGTSPDPDGLTQEIDIPDGYEVDVSEGGWKQTPDGKWELESPSGSGHLTYDPETGDLTYTLDKPFDHTKPGTDIGQEVIPGIVIKDDDGNKFEVEVKVDLEDDVPELIFTGENAVESGDSITGKWDVDFGADGPAEEDALTVTVKHPSSQGSIEVSFDPDDLPKSVDIIIDDVNYGKLTLNDDKTYEFEAAPDLEGERLDVTISAKDGDGDVTVSDTVVIEIVEPGGPGIGYLTTKDGSAFEEANFSSGTYPDQAALTKVLNLPDGFTIDVGKGGWQLEFGSSRYILESPAVKGPDGKLTNGFGKLTYDSESNTLTYTLTGRVFNGPDSDLGMDTIPDIVLKDKNGNSFELDVVVDILDDAPDLDFSGEGEISSGGTFTGDWSYMFGADGAADSDAIVITVTDAHGNSKSYSLAVGSDTEIAVGGVRYGALHLGDDGKFTFKAMPNVEGKLSLSMTISDKDGDSVTTESPFELEFSKPELPPGFVIGGGENEWFSESYLKGGTEAGDPDAFVTRELALPKNSNGDLCVPDVSDWIKKGDGVYIKQGGSGRLTWDENTGKLTYTLEKAATHKDPGKHGPDDVALENIQITLKDPQGNTYVVGSEIKLHDDAPRFDLALEQETVEAGGSLTGSLGLQFGADGPASGAKALQVEVTLTVDGKEVTFTVPLTVGRTGQLVHDGVNYGSITVDKNYAFTFKAAPNLTHEVKVNFAATDKDGDVVWSSGDGDGTSIIIVPPKVTPPGVIGKGDDEWFAESNLPGGTEEDAGALAKPIAIPKGYTIDTTGWTSVGGKGSNIFELESASGKLTYDASKNTLTYTLTDNIQHGDPATSGDADVVMDDIFNLILKDANDNTFNVNAEIAVYDDAPEADMLGSGGDVDGEGQSGKEFTGTWEVRFGADGAATDTATALDLAVSVSVYPTDAEGNQLPGAPREYSFSFELTEAHLRGEPIQLGNFGTIVFVESPAGSGKGSFTFKPAGNLMADFDFKLGATDSDGDHRVVNGGDGFNFSVTPTPPPVPESEGLKADGPVDEAHLGDGTDPDPSGLTTNVPLPVTSDGTQCTVDVSQGGWERQGNTDIWTLAQGSGTLTYDKGSNTLTYTLTDNVQHGAPGSATDSSSSQNIHIVITDGDNTWGRDVIVSVTDDAPEVDMLGKDGQAGGSGQSGREFTGTWEVDFGADGASVATETGISLAVSVKVYPTDAEGNPLPGAPKDHTLNLDLSQAQLRGEPIQIGDYGVISFVESPAGSGKGSFVFKPAGNLKADFEFKLGATDSDGDFRTNNDGNGFEFKVTPTPPPVPETEGLKADNPVDEAHLPGGTDPDQSGLSTNIPLPVTSDGTQCTVDVSQGGWERQGNSDVWTLVQGGGKLTYDKGSNTLTYTLTDNVEHGAPGSSTDASTSQNIPIVITDGENTWGRDVIATVSDDAPEVEFGGDSNEASSGHEFTGTWEVDFGADGEKTENNEGLQLKVTVDGKDEVFNIRDYPKAGADNTYEFDIVVDGKTYGKITMVDNPDGENSYTFVPVPNLDAQLNFVLGATDTDGDFRTNNDGDGFTITVTPPPGPGIDDLGGGKDEWFSDANIDKIGTAADHSQATKAIGIPDGYTIDTSADGWVYKGEEGGYKVWTKVNSDAGANNGTLTYYQNDEGQRLTYTLTSPGKHSEQGTGLNDKAYGSVGSVTLKDSAGNTYEVGTKFVIYDDQPEVSLSGDATADSGKTYIGGWSVVYGADGPAGENSLQAEVSVKIKTGGGEVEVNGSITVDVPFVIKDASGKEYGTIILKNGGLFEFTPIPNLKADFSFDLVAVDGDGDVVHADGGGLNISVAPPKGPGVTEILTKDGGKPDEANLESGSRPDEAALGKEINVPDGYRVDTSGWQDKGGGVFELSAGRYGKLVYDGTSLKYVLTDSANHGSQGKDVVIDSVPGVILVDEFGNRYEVNAKVEIVDDMAVAGISGNEESVSSGGEHTGSWSVEYGADGPADDGPLQVRITANGKTQDFTFTPGQQITVEIDGIEYGKITFNGDKNGGGYIFEAAPDLYPVDLSFAVIARDGDGDVTVSKGVNLQVTDPDGPGINHLGGKEGEEFYEKNLGWGTEPSSEGLLKPIALPDGFSIDTDRQALVGTESRSWQETSQGSGVFVLKGAYGTLTYTAGDPPSLTYRLDKQAGHPAGEGENSTLDHIKGITLKDAGNNSHPIDAKIEIVDDVPDIKFGGTDDTNIVSGHDYTGNWSAKHGADGEADGDEKLFLIVKTGGKSSDPIGITPGEAAEITIDGKVYGTITLDQNTGRYVFTAAPDTTAVLDFTLYGTDADGDRSDSGREFTINVERATDPNLPDHLGGNQGEGFDEANLPGGTANDTAALTKTIAVPDGYTIDTGDWTPAGNGVWTKAGANGYLKYDTNGSSPKLTYTLESAPKVVGEGKNVFQDVISDITLKDGKGNTFELDAKISITDDVPQVNFGSSGGASGTVTSGGEFASGSWNVEYGADGAASSGSLILQVGLVGGATGAAIEVVTGSGPIEIKIGNTVYGHLTLNADNTYTFEAEPNVTGQLNFSLTAKDADNDTARSSGFDLTIRAANGPDISHLGYDKTFSEANFDNGTDKNTGLLTQQLEVPKGFSIDVTSPGWVLQSDGSYKLAGAKGFLTCSADGKTLKYTLTERVANDGTDSVEHDDHRGFDLIPNIKLIDDKGNDFYLNAKIEILDDAPELDFSGGKTIHVDSGAQFTSDEGGYVLKFGADGSSQTTEPLKLFASVGDKQVGPLPVPPGGSSDVIIDGVNYGKLFLNSDGTFSFKASPNLGADKPIHLNLSLLATDRDGDVASTQDKPVTIVITKPEGPDAGYFIGGNGERFFESNLPDGTASNNGALTQELALPKGYVPDTTGWTSVGNGVFTKAGDNNCGKLTWDGSKLTYTLEKNAAHSAPGTANDDAVQDLFSGIKLKDANGNTYDVPAKITIMDDAPTVEFKATDNDTPEDVYAVESGSVSTGSLEIEAGADGLASIKIDGIDVSGGTASKPIMFAREGGTLKVWNDNGTIRYEYTAKTNQGLTGDKQDKFTVTVTDKDGDQVSDTLTMNVGKKNLGGEDDNEIGKGEDGARANEAGLINGSSAGDGSTKSGWVAFELPEGASSIETGTFNGKYGTFEITFDQASGKYKYHYTLNTNYQHKPGDDIAYDVDRVVVTIKDDKGNTGKASLYADIVDDEPSAEFKADGGIDKEDDIYSVESGSVSTGSIAVVEGADGVKSVKVDGVAITAGNDSNNPAVFARDAGTLKVWYENGVIRYEYTAKPNAELTDKKTDSFTVEVLDNDGDIGSDTLTIKVGKKDLGGEDDNEIGKGEEGARANEAGLANGSSANDGSAQSEWVSFELPEGAASIDTGEFNGTYGKFEIQFNQGTGKYEYRYTLNTNYSHNAGDDIAYDVDRVVVTIRDDKGNSGKASLYADIVDDEPAAEFIADGGKDKEDDTYSVESGSLSTGHIAVVQGADGLKSVLVDGQEITSGNTGDNPAVFNRDAGTLKVWYENGIIKYEYKAKANADLTDKRTDSFTVEVIDNDGDRDSDTLTMKVGKKDLGGEDDNEIGKGEEGARANEAGLANGSSANDGSAQSEWIAIELPEGATSIATGTFQGQYGSFQIIHDQASGVYKYQYTLNKNYKHDAGADIAYDVDKIVVTIEDDNGNTGKASIYADIVDDSPSVEFVATDGDTPEDEYAVSTGSVSTGTLTTIGGADGIASLKIGDVEVSGATSANPKLIQGDGGTLKVWKDSNGVYRYEYTAKERAELTSSVTDEFKVTLVDGDGDKSEDSLSMTVTPPNTAPVAVDDYAAINEDGEQSVSGNLLANDSDADGDTLTVTRTGEFTTSYGTITINADGTYSYKVDLNNSDVRALYDGASTDPAYKLTDSFTYQVSDGYGGTHEATISIDLTPNQLRTPENGGNEVTGGPGNDVILGDAIGQEDIGNITYKAYNISIILDTSRSFEDQIDGAVRAVEALATMLEEMGENPYTHVNFSFITFDTDSSLKFSLNGLDTKAELEAFKQNLQGIKAEGTFTNYQHAFMQSSNWFSNQPKTVTDEFGGQGKDVAYNNVVYFITDGSPSAIVQTTWPLSTDALAGEGYPAVTILDWIPGQELVATDGEYQTRISADGMLGYRQGSDSAWTEVQSVLDLPRKPSPSRDEIKGNSQAAFDRWVADQDVDVNAIGVGVGTNVLNSYDNTGGAAFVDPQSPTFEEDLKKELIDNGSIKWEDEPTQASVIRGGTGFSLIYGDAITADWLLEDNSWDHSSLRPGKSLEIVRQYVMQTQNMAENDPKLNDAIRRFIEDNAFKLGLSEEDRGSNDIIHASEKGSIIFAQGGNDTVYGGAGNDLIVGGEGNDSLQGGAGADVFLFNPDEGNDTIGDFNRAEGDIIVKVGEGTFGTITGDYDQSDVREVKDVRHGHQVTISDSDNHLLVGSGINSNKIDVDGAKYDNVLKGGGGDDVIFGGSGNNLLIGGDGNDHIIGGPDNDRIEGGSGNDFIHAGAGDDIIFGGSGNNTIIGGKGADTFAWNNLSSGGKDNILDFSTGEGDRLSFEDLLDPGESIEIFIDNHINNLTMDTVNGTLNFTIKDGSFSKDVELHFDPANDSVFRNVISEYNGAAGQDQQQEVLANFLLSISNN